MCDQLWQDTDWVNEETRTIARWLVSSGHIDILVRRWDEEKLLGVDLAASLKKLTESIDGSFGRILNDVDWNQIAEQFALHFAGVDEEELSRRRNKQLR